MKQNNLNGFPPDKREGRERILKQQTERGTINKANRGRKKLSPGRKAQLGKTGSKSSRERGTRPKKKREGKSLAGFGEVRQRV